MNNSYRFSSIHIITYTDKRFRYDFKFTFPSD